MKNPRFMMMVLACTALLTFTKCGSDDPSPKAADVYVAGNFNTLAGEGGYNWIPACWKNGEMEILTEDNGDADVIGVNNGVVYVLGDLDGDNNKRIRMWTDGDMTDFINGSDYVYVYAMKFYGDDMYVVGTINDHAAYWINGSPHPITTTLDSRALDIVIDGGDVYVAGYERVENGYSVATVWKNGVSTGGLSAGTEYAEASGVAILDGVVYACGTVGQTLMMWEDLDGTPLGTVGNSGTGSKSIAIHKGDVYIVGDDNDVAMLWKNGEGTPLPYPESLSASSAYEIAFDGNDLFILGDGTIDANKSSMLVWKNGQLVTPYDGTIEFYANSLSVARPN